MSAGIGRKVSNQNNPSQNLPNLITFNRNIYIHIELSNKDNEYSHGCQMFDNEKNVQMQTWNILISTTLNLQI